MIHRRGGWAAQSPGSTLDRKQTRPRQAQKQCRVYFLAGEMGNLDEVPEGDDDASLALAFALALGGAGAGAAATRRRGLRSGRLLATHTPALHTPRRRKEASQPSHPGQQAPPPPPLPVHPSPVSQSANQPAPTRAAREERAAGSGPGLSTPSCESWTEGRRGKDGERGEKNHAGRRGQVADDSIGGSLIFIFWRL